MASFGGSSGARYEMLYALAYMYTGSSPFPISEVRAQSMRYLFVRRRNHIVEHVFRIVYFCSGYGLGFSVFDCFVLHRPPFCFDVSRYDGLINHNTVRAKGPQEATHHSVLDSFHWPCDFVCHQSKELSTINQVCGFLPGSRLQESTAHFHMLSLKGLLIRRTRPRLLGSSYWQSRVHTS